MYPQECFAYYKKLFWPVICLKRLGLPCCTFVTSIITCSLQIILLSNYSLLIISVLEENTLLKTTCHFLLLLLGFDTLTYRKDYRSPILVGHQPLTESQHTYHQNIKHTSSSYDYLQHDFSRDLKNKSNYSQLIIMRSEGY